MTTSTAPRKAIAPVEPAEDRAPPRPALHVGEVHHQRRARQQRDDGRDPRQLAQLRRKIRSLLVQLQPGSNVGARHSALQCSHAFRIHRYAEMSSLDFSHQEVLRARTYHRPLYLALVADTALSVAVLVVLGWVWSGPYHLVSGLGWAGAAAGYAAIVITLSSLVRLPLGYWRGFVRERRWGFSTQTAGAWLVDRAKGWGVSVVLVAAGVDGGRRARARVPVGLARGRGRRARRRRPRALVPGAARVRAALQPLRAARRTSGWRESCAISRSAPAFRCATSSSPTRAGGRRR